MSDLDQTDDQGRPLPVSWCPDCGYGPLECATLVSKHDEGVRPTPGTVSVCMSCGAFLEFDDELRLRTLPLAKLRDLDPEARDLLHRARRVIHEMYKEEERGA